MVIKGEDLTLVRKALQLMAQAHSVTETADEKDDRETAVDRLIRRIRDEEERNNEVSCRTCEHNEVDFCKYWGEFPAGTMTCCSKWKRAKEE